MPEPTPFDFLVAIARKHRLRGRTVFETARAMLHDPAMQADHERVKSAIRSVYAF
ncbi:hypothetical protein [Cognatishimia sp. F0-27]|uniref:hypothetical protein n=1 Tax=Cognatishimia sp. F0-27 TaxID=2816855 RepID=UPI001D0C3FCB|nr:hypothetical protein [Cognatishimia sp. F0-27]MCC1492127.1 hypothetical protein [Cognatishimia sp. F0-27]